MIVHVGRESELPGQEDGATVEVVGKNHGAVAAVVGLSLLAFPASVSSSVVEGGAPEYVPALRGQFDTPDHDIRIAGQPPSRAIEAGASAVIGDVDAGLPAHAIGVSEFITRPPYMQ